MVADIDVAIHPRRQVEIAETGLRRGEEISTKSSKVHRTRVRGRYSRLLAEKKALLCRGPDELTATMALSLTELLFVASASDKINIRASGILRSANCFSTIPSYACEAVVCTGAAPLTIAANCSRPAHSPGALFIAARAFWTSAIKLTIRRGSVNTLRLGARSLA